MGSIAFDKIDNKFIWGKCENFKIIIMKCNGYINATKLCSKNGNPKKFKEWIKTDMATEIIEEFSNIEGIDVECLTTVVKSENIDITGTYIHPLLAPVVAPPKSVVKVVKIINKYQDNKFKKELHERDDEIVELRNEILDLMCSNEKLEKEFREVITDTKTVIEYTKQLMKNDKQLRKDVDSFTEKSNKMIDKLDKVCDKWVTSDDEAEDDD